MLTLDNYLKFLQEEIINEAGYTFSLMKIQGISFIEYTNCTNRCNRTNNTYEKSLCEMECEAQRLNNVINGLRKEKANCSKASNPQSCLEQINNSIKSRQEKLIKVQERVNKTKRSKWRIAAGIASAFS